MRQFFIIFLFPLLISGQTESKKIRVLFLGNSYTYVNNLPQMIKDVALSQKDTLIFDSYSPGGYTFNNHANDPTTLAKISLGIWDYVILQAQSQEPSFSPAQVNSQTLPFALKLDSLINHFNPCANSVFYETWGRKYGDVGNCPFYPPICTYTGMQNRLRESYKLFADTVHDILAPVGEAFRNVISTNSVINLYQSDDSHPSIEGTYLAAAVFYETLFQKSVLTASYNPGVAANDFNLLRQVAHQTVSDSLDVWNISKYIPKAQFTYTAQSSSNIQFQGNTTPFLYKWYFGDGSISNLQNPTHSYSLSGTYTVSLLVYDNMLCKKDSVSQVVTAAVSTTGLSHLVDNSSFSVFPNPSQQYLNIQLKSLKEQERYSIKIYDLYGRLCLEFDSKNEIVISELAEGVYLILIEQKEKKVYTTFVKQN